MLVFMEFMSCVSKSAYDSLEMENQQLKQEIETLQMAKREQEKKERLTLLKQHTEEEALKLIKDYYNFYYANMIYRKPKVRRVSSSKFVVSLEECPKKGGFSEQDFYWNSRVLNLTINGDGTYDVN